jgi:hypothetical protein
LIAWLDGGTGQHRSKPVVGVTARRRRGNQFVESVVMFGGSNPGHEPLLAGGI